MATCISCGAAITWRKVDGERIPLDEHDTMRGPHRYTERNGELVKVSDKAEVLARADHRETCPFSKTGRRR